MSQPHLRNSPKTPQYSPSEEVIETRGEWTTFLPGNATEVSLISRSELLLELGSVVAELRRLTSGGRWLRPLRIKVQS